MQAIIDESLHPGLTRLASKQYRPGCAMVEQQGKKENRFFRTLTHVDRLR
jgi:hypothetical protein